MRREHVWVLRGVLAATAALAMAGCFKGNFANCAVSCASSADCPGELACSAQGVCSVGGASCEGMMPMPDADLNKPQPLTVTKTGDGTVASTPAGIDCGSTCMAEFDPLSSVMLTATPGANTVFDGWTGDCASSTTTDCSLTMDGPKTTGATFAQHASLRWTKQVSFSGDDMRDGGITTDAEGNVIAVGTISDADTPYIYAIKYAKSDGSVMWEKKIGTDVLGIDIGGVDADAAGNIYLCARLSSFGMSGVIGGVTVTGDLYGNILGMRLAAADGSPEWVKQWGGTGQDICNGLVVSGTDLFVAGETSSNPSDFGTVSLTGGSQGTVFLVKVTAATGTPTRGVLMNGNFDLYAIAAADGRVAVGGAARAASTNVPNCNVGISGGAGTDHGLIMAFDSNLTCSFARVFGANVANQPTTVFGLAAAPGGDWISTGAFQGSVFFVTGSGSAIPSQGMSDAFIARYNSTGSYVYAFGYGTGGNEVGRSLDVTSTGEVAFTGEFSASITFGSTTLTGTNDIFVTRMSAGPAPLHQWAQKIGGSAYDLGHNVAFGPDGTVNLSAYWTGMTDVLGTAMTAQSYDGWITSLVR